MQFCLQICISLKILRTLSKRLCYRSSIFMDISPGLLITDHGVEDGEQFVHAGDDGRFEGLAGVAKSLVEAADCGVEPSG
jgi:hypothetical protein